MHEVCCTKNGAERAQPDIAEQHLQNGIEHRNDQHTEDGTWQPPCQRIHAKQLDRKSDQIGAKQWMYCRIHILTIGNLPGIARMIDFIKVCLLHIGWMNRDKILLINDKRSRIFGRKVVIFLYRHWQKAVFTCFLEGNLCQSLILAGCCNADIAVIPAAFDGQIFIDGPFFQRCNHCPAVQVIGSFNRHSLHAKLQRTQIGIVVTFAIDHIDLIKRSILTQLENE